MNANSVVSPFSLRTPRSTRLLSRSFVGLVLTQLLTATNDNAFRWLVIGIGKDYAKDEANFSAVLVAGSISFLLPYLILAAPAGYLADRFSKRNVIVACKVAEIVVMALGIAAIMAGQFWMLLVVLALMGSQSALFSPSKLGAIPEMLTAEKISAANGVMGLTTVISTIGGTAIGLLLADATGHKGQERVWLSAVVLLGIAAIGWLVSLGIARLTAANPSRRFPWDAPVQVLRDMKILASSRPLLRVALGIAFFWSLGILANMNIDRFAAEGGMVTESAKTPLLVSLVVGVGLGSVMAGIWSGGRVELGILPLGALGIAANSFLLFTVQQTIVDPSGTITPAFLFACFFLFGLGFSAGLFDVPLASYMQDRSPPEHRGAVLAATNFLAFSGMLVMSVLYLVLRTPLSDGQPLFSSRQIFALGGVMTIPVLVYIVWLLPQVSIRFIVWLASRTIYRVRMDGAAYLPQQGGAVVAANHVSWIDGVMLMLASPRPLRLIAFGGHLQARWLDRLAQMFGVITIGAGPKSIRAALDRARQAVQQGDLVCIFPEGAITRTGQLQSFRPGLLKIIEDTHAPVIPAYLDELWGSIFSFEGGKFFWKRPRKWRYPISIFFGQPIERPGDMFPVRQAVLELGARAVIERAQRSSQLTYDFVRACKRRKRSSKVADSMGIDLTGGALLARTLLLRRVLRRHVWQPDERHIGLLVPASTAGLVANAAVAVDRRVAVNLNYTSAPPGVNACIETAQIRHVLTSRRFLETLRQKRQLDYARHITAELVYLEDLLDKPTSWDKLIAALQAYIMPAWWLARRLDLRSVQSEDVVAVIFTSGSTGAPKGVMLSYGNVASNVAAVNQIVNLRTSDVLIGVLPFFHSFGYTLSMWTVMAMDVKGAYHADPMEARQIGQLCQEHKGTVLLATPTFLRSYLRRCTPEQLATLEVVVAGAEKLPRQLCDRFEEKFGVRPVEGYGATELSPLVAVNIPPNRSLTGDASGLKEGTVGRPIPGVAVRVVDIASGQLLRPDQPGLLLVTGPNVMLGYLGQDDLTKQVVRDGWYVTGDVATVDEDGFLTITGRESRFSKIGGEMVPHILIEQTLNQILGGDENSLRAAVTAVPDSQKGERLVVIHAPVDKSPDVLRQELLRAGLPHLYVPSAESFIQVQRLPILETGKLDLKRLQAIAAEKLGSAVEDAGKGLA